MFSGPELHEESENRYEIFLQFLSFPPEGGIEFRVTLYSTIHHSTATVQYSICTIWSAQDCTV